MPPPTPPVRSAARALIQEAKRRGPHGSVPLVAKARALADASATAEALFFLSDHAALPAAESRALALEAVDAAGRVEPDAARAELLAELARQLGGWRDRDLRAAAADALADLVLALPPGMDRSDAIQNVAVGVDARSPLVLRLLSRALGHDAFALDDAKSIVRAWARGLGSELDERALREVVALVEAAPDPALRAHALGYVHLQAQKGTNGHAPTNALDAALDAVALVPVSARADALRYVGTVAHAERDLQRVRGSVDALPDPEARARVLGTLAGFAVKRGFHTLALQWLGDGARAADGVERAAARAVTRASLAKGCVRAREADAARALVDAARADVDAVADAAERARVGERVREAAAVVGVALPADWP